MRTARKRSERRWWSADARRCVALAQHHCQLRRANGAKNPAGRRRNSGGVSISSGAGTSQRRHGRPEGESRLADEQVSVIGKGEEAVSGRSVQRKEGRAKAPYGQALDVRCDRGGPVTAPAAPTHPKATFIRLMPPVKYLSKQAVRSRTAFAPLASTNMTHARTHTSSE